MVLARIINVSQVSTENYAECHLPGVDIPYNSGFCSWLLDRQDEHLAYACILGKDGGVPLIFSDHNESTAQFLEDLDRWQGAFNRQNIVDMISFHNAVQGTSHRSNVADHLMLDGFALLVSGVNDLD